MRANCSHQAPLCNCCNLNGYRALVLRNWKSPQSGHHSNVPCFSLIIDLFVNLAMKVLYKTSFLHISVFLCSTRLLFRLLSGLGWLTWSCCLTTTFGLVVLRSLCFLNLFLLNLFYVLEEDVEISRVVWGLFALGNVSCWQLGSPLCLSCLD